MSNIRIDSIVTDSIAQELGISSGDLLIKINGESVKDIFDYKFLTTDEKVLVEILTLNGELVEFEIEKDEYEDLGLEFENDLIEEASSCSNKCVFCFIDQLPKGMRDTLYFKDDDSRLSFLTGNYVTLTNVSDEELDRVIKYKMSPINISVHTINPSLRIKMLRNKKAGNIIERINKLTQSGIEVNCQIVLCRGINDGEELQSSVEELGKFYPQIRSISVVPVGITKHRQKLYPLHRFDKDSAVEVIEQINFLQNIFLERYDSRVVYLADEFYIMAGIEFPPYEDYEDFPQIENGVGLITSFVREFWDCIKEITQIHSPNKGNIKDKKNGKSYSEKPINISIATGVSAYSTIAKLANELEKLFAGLNIHIYSVRNDFFGDTVNVTGLLTGQDIISQLQDKELGERLLLCRAMFKANTDILLDDYSLSDIQNKLGILVEIVDNTGEDFINKILGEGEKNCQNNRL